MEKIKYLTSLFKKIILTENLKVIKYFLEKGLGEPKYGLNYACFLGNIEIAELMITFNRKSKKSILDWALYKACKGGHLKMIDFIISHGADDWDQGLLGACKGGHLNLVQLMISMGANDWNWVFYGACYSGNKEIIQLIISKGADNWERGFVGACAGGHKEIVELMISKTKGDIDLHNGFLKACLKGKLEIVKLIIDYDIKFQNFINYEVYYEVCYSGNLQLIELMFSNGVVCDHLIDGLRGACLGGHLSLVQLLIDYGASDTENIGITSAIKSGNLELINYLKKLNCEKPLFVNFNILLMLHLYSIKKITHVSNVLVLYYKLPRELMTKLLKVY